MDSSDIKVNLNQNLWGLLVSLSTLGSAEFFGLCSLYWFGLILSILTSLSFLVTLIAYTRNYWKNKTKSSNAKLIQQPALI